MLTQERLKELLNYDPLTGIFTRKITTGRCERWKAGTIAGHIRKDGYLHIKIDGKSYLAHRLAWLYVYGEWPADDIDHRFHNTLDNRIDELRGVSNFENMQNRIKANSNNTTGFLGVSFHKAKGKYSAEITFDRQRKHLGLFITAEEAHAAYIEAKRIYHSTCTI